MKFKSRFLFCMIVFLGLILILNLSNVVALGITPGRTTLTYEPGSEKEIELTIINNDHKSMRVMLMSKMGNDANGTIVLFNDYIDFMPSEERKNVKYKVNLPMELSTGLHTGEITALEVPKTNNNNNSLIGATVAVVSQLFIYVPCPGKCVEIDLDVLDSEQNSTATFIVPVISRGKLDIAEARAIIDIYSFSNNKVATIESDYQPVPIGERTELVAKWNTTVNPGDYKAKVTVFYDGQSTSMEKVFAVGIKSLSIDSILVNNFRLGEIAKLQILVENRWNQELSSVYANLLVYNQDKQVMADVKSAAENIPALSKKELLAYWDTVGVKVGEYDGKLMVKYGEKSTDKNLVLKVSEDSLDITGVGYAIRPQGGKGTSVTTILLILVILLLIVNLAWFVFFRRFMNSRKNQFQNNLQSDNKRKFFGKKNQ